MSLSALTQSLLTNCIDKHTFSYYLHLPLQTLRCAHVLPEIFLQSQLILLLLSLSLTLLLVFNTCAHFNHCHCPYFTLCHSLLPLDTPSALSFIFHHSSLSLRVSLHLLSHPLHSCVDSWWGLSTHYFSSQSGMTWSNHINLIGKLEKRSCYKHSREDTNDFGAQTV